MTVGKIKLRIFPDGRVEAEVDGIPGSACMKFIPLVEQLVGGETVDSQRTPSYFFEQEVDSETPEIETTGIKGSH